MANYYPPPTDKYQRARLLRRALWHEAWFMRTSRPERVPMFHPRHLEASRLRIHWVRPARVAALLARGFGVYMGGL